MLTERTVQNVLRTLNQEYNLWDADPRDAETVSQWQRRLIDSGLTDANAAERIARLLRGLHAKKPTRHDICQRLRDQENGRGRLQADTPERHAAWLRSTLMGMNAPEPDREAFAAEHPEYVRLPDPQALAAMFWPWLEVRQATAEHPFAGQPDVDESEIPF